MPAGDTDDTTPVVFVHKVGGALRLAAVDCLAASLGLTSGMTLADAQARTPAVRSVVHQPEGDEALLKRVLEDWGRFSPMAALDGHDGLVLDVTGCAHLFAGEAGLMHAVKRRAAGIGLQVRLAMSDTAESARAWARFGPGGILAKGQARTAGRRLRINALELPEKEEQALSRAGLKTLAHLDDRPTAPLTARFGSDLPTRLRRVLGLEDARITPSRPAGVCAADRILVEPITETADVEAVVGDLLVEVMDRLDQRGQGGRAFQAAFFRVDGEVRRITIRTGRPTRDAPAVLRLFRERLASLARPLDPGFGFDHLRLTIPVAQRLAYAQSGLEAEAPQDDLGPLIDRLSARLGPQAVVRIEPVQSHAPERAERFIAAAEALDPAGDWGERDPADPPLRPLQVFDPPQPVEAMAALPDGSPARFRWRRIDHVVTRAEGPERIAGEWWHRPKERTRDYYRVEDGQGRRFWVFRAGFYGEEPPPRWYLHGVFA